MNGGTNSEGELTLALRALRDRAPREPIDVDIADYSDVYCLGFLAGQTNALDAALATLAQRGRPLPPRLSAAGGRAAPS